MNQGIKDYMAAKLRQGDCEVDTTAPGLTLQDRATDNGAGVTIGG